MSEPPVVDWKEYAVGLQARIRDLEASRKIVEKIWGVARGIPDWQIALQVSNQEGGTVKLTRAEIEAAIRGEPCEGAPKEEP